MLQPWRTGTVIRIEQEAEMTRRFWIQIPELESFDFEPGQFVTLDLPIHEKPAKRIRSYSIASWPDGSNVIELVIVFLEGGAGTFYLFNHVTVGSQLTLRGPQGVFTLPEIIERDLFFICTGTGVAPFRSMTHFIMDHNVPHQDIYLIFGCRKLEDALYRKELTELAEQIPRFHYIPTFSRETVSPGGPLIRTGYVHPIYEELCGGRQPAYFFLCGWKNMIDEAKQRITSLGYERKSIHQELYG
ncbi:MAG TPA: FAD-dependent oxidoreductase [Puia sp.]|nr:FAD-dependent oxidoreductase [Puia sp.]